jgi:hypothetical protein
MIWDQDPSDPGMYPLAKPASVSYPASTPSLVSYPTSNPSVSYSAAPPQSPGMTSMERPAQDNYGLSSPVAAGKGVLGYRKCEWVPLALEILRAQRCGEHVRFTVFQKYHCVRTAHES